MGHQYDVWTFAQRAVRRHGFCFVHVKARSGQRPRLQRIRKSLRINGGSAADIIDMGGAGKHGKSARVDNFVRSGIPGQNQDEMIRRRQQRVKLDRKSVV